MIDVVKCACNPKLSIPFIGIIVYTGILVFLAQNFSIWSWIYLKDILIWLVFTGVPNCYNAVYANINEHYFRKLFTDNLKMIMLIEFISNTFTFNIIVEIILIPFITIIVIMNILAEREEHSEQVKKLMSMALSIIGLVILGLSLKEFIHISDIEEVKVLAISFIIPIVFSLLYIPIAYLFAIFSRYVMLFLRMSFKSPDNKKIFNKRKILVVKICKVSVKKIIEFENKCLPYMYISMSDNEFNKLIAKVKHKRRFVI